MGENRRKFLPVLALTISLLVPGAAHAQTATDTISFQIPDRFGRFQVGVTLIDEVEAAYGAPAEVKVNEDTGIATASWNGLDVTYRHQSPSIVHNVRFSGEQQDVADPGIALGRGASEVRSRLIDKLGRPYFQSGADFKEEEPFSLALVHWSHELPDQDNVQHKRSRTVLVRFSDGKLISLMMGGPAGPYSDDERAHIDAVVAEQKRLADDWRDRIGGTIWQTVAATGRTLAYGQTDRFEEHQDPVEYHWFGADARCIRFSGDFADLGSLSREDCGHWALDQVEFHAIDGRGKLEFSAHFDAPNRLAGEYAGGLRDDAWRAVLVDEPAPRALRAYLQAPREPRAGALAVYNYEVGVLTWSEFLGQGWSGIFPTTQRAAVLSAHGSVSGTIDVRIGTFLYIDRDRPGAHIGNYSMIRDGSLQPAGDIRYRAYVAKRGQRIPYAKPVSEPFEECDLKFEAGVLTENSCAWFGVNTVE
ncbi:MAG: hypothetical protein QNJ14_12855 [Woeseiaceae bacterium]|nr:hypothetical protein [Woeseiaceae bacterium]